MRMNDCYGNKVKKFLRIPQTGLDPDIAEKTGSIRTSLARIVGNYMYAFS